MNDDIRPGESGSPDHAQAPRRDYVPGSDAGNGEDVAKLLVESFDPVEPDPSVWSRITAQISDTDPVAREGAETVLPIERRRGFLPAMFAVAAVIFAVVGTVVVFGATVDGGSAVASGVVYELMDPQSGSVAMTLTVAEDGTATASAVELASLGSDQTYQLWSVVGDEIVSAGLLGSEPGEVPLRIEGDPAVLALTVEVAGGVAVSEAAPVAVWQASS